MNLLNAEDSQATRLLGHSLDQVASRLDALLLVLKSCQGGTCTQPWRALHPDGNVENMRDALSPRFDDFYVEQQKKVAYSRCEYGYIEDAEGPQFQRDGLVYRNGIKWSEWV